MSEEIENTKHPKPELKETADLLMPSVAEVEAVLRVEGSTKVVNGMEERHARVAALQKSKSEARPVWPAHTFPWEKP